MSYDNMQEGYDLDFLVGTLVFAGTQEARFADICIPYQYSKDVSHARHIVKHLTARGWVVVTTETRNETTVVIQRWNDNNYDGTVVGCGGTFPLAICRAALKAVQPAAQEIAR